MELVLTTSGRRIGISIDHLREKDWNEYGPPQGEGLELVSSTSGRRIDISIDHLREKD